VHGDRSFLRHLSVAFIWLFVPVPAGGGTFLSLNKKVPKELSQRGRLEPRRPPLESPRRPFGTPAIAKLWQALVPRRPAAVFRNGAIQQNDKLEFIVDNPYWLCYDTENHQTVDAGITAATPPQRTRNAEIGWETNCQMGRGGRSERAFLSSMRRRARVSRRGSYQILQSAQFSAKQGGTAEDSSSLTDVLSWAIFCFGVSVMKPGKRWRPLY